MHKTALKNVHPGLIYRGKGEHKLLKGNTTGNKFPCFKLTFPRRTNGYLITGYDVLLVTLNN